MRILLTGTTTLMSNKQRLSTSTFISFFPLLYEMLVDLGHEVDWRAVKPGERISRDYDVALLGLQAVNGLAGKQYRYGTLWSATQLPHAVVFDDWQVRTSARSLRYRGGENTLSLDDEASLETDNLWKKAMLGRRELEEREYALEHCFNAIERVRQRWFEQLPTVIAPLFSWGRHEQFEKLHPMRKLVAIDPFAYVPNMNVEPISVKGRRWYYAGLKDHGATLVKMGLDGVSHRWPLITKMPVSGKRGWGRVTERAVVQMYADSWGVVSVPYSKLMLGTGWWRSRFNFCAQVGSIMLADPRELGRLDTSAYGLDISEVEALDDAGLRRLAAAQYAELVGHWGVTKERLKDVLSQTLNEVATHGEKIQ